MVIKILIIRLRWSMQAEQHLTERCAEQGKICVGAVSSPADWSTSICGPSWYIGVFPSQKPWFNADICSQIRNCPTAFKSRGIVKYGHICYELQKFTKAAKRTY